MSECKHIYWHEPKINVPHVNSHVACFVFIKTTSFDSAALDGLDLHPIHTPLAVLNNRAERSIEMEFCEGEGFESLRLRQEW